MRTNNGFGRIVQKIIVHVDRKDRDAASVKLGILPFKEAGAPMRAYFAWTRLTIRAGSDKDVVFDLALLLDGRSDQIDWQVDWSASEY
ncbi:hypothetical protein BTE77_00010 [Ensifer adhaerens]|nr:hypothetical protein BTE77_00010 [Ensifer adhaerens]